MKHVNAESRYNRRPCPNAVDNVEQNQPSQHRLSGVPRTFTGSFLHQLGEGAGVPETPEFVPRKLVQERRIRGAVLAGGDVPAQCRHINQRKQARHGHGGAGARAQAELQALPGAPGANTRLPPVFRLRDPLERERQVRRQRPQRRTGLAAAPRRHRLTLTAQVVHLSDP
jgi:hypothetical protein